MNRKFNRLGEYYLSIINNAHTSATSHQLYGDPSMVVKPRQNGVEIIPPDSIYLGRSNTFSLSNTGLPENNVDFTVYMPSYMDSHDWLHTYPYSYLYYSKNDGAVFKSSLKIDDTISIDVPFPDTLESKKYVGKLLTTALYETDSVIYMNAIKPYGPFLSDSGFSVSLLSVDVKYNNSNIKDTVFLPQKYSLDIDVTSANGVYSGNISKYIPFVDIRNDKGERINEQLEYFSYIPELGVYRKSIAFTSTSLMDTLKISVYDNSLQGIAKKIFIEHKQGIKGFDNYTIYPNPFTDIFNVSFNANGAGYGKTTVINENGAVMKEFSFRFNNGFNTFRCNFEGSNVLPGVYLVKTVLSFYGRNGDYPITKKAVKKG